MEKKPTMNEHVQLSECQCKPPPPKKKKNYNNDDNIGFPAQFHQNCIQIHE